MIDWFETRFPQRPVLPPDPVLSLICRLLEDYADEWMWRPALHYRWNYATDARLYSHRFTQEFLAHTPLPRGFTAFWLRQRQNWIYLTGDGIRSSTKKHVESIYLRNLAWLEAILQQQDYLLGARPCLLDFGYFASMFRHFSLDPTPARIMRESAPAVYLWVARMWQARPVEGPWPSEVPQSWGPLLQDLGEAYLPYLQANALAWQRGQRHFDLKLQGTEYRKLPVVHYRVWCLERLQQHLGCLEGPDLLRAKALLGPYHCLESLLPTRIIRSNLHAQEADPALCIPAPKQNILAYLYRYFVGTHWHKPGK